MDETSYKQGSNQKPLPHLLYAQLTLPQSSAYPPSLSLLDFAAICFIGLVLPALITQKCQLLRDSTL